MNTKVRIKYRPLVTTATNFYLFFQRERFEASVYSEIFKELLNYNFKILVGPEAHFETLIDGKIKHTTENINSSNYLEDLSCKFEKYQSGFIYINSFDSAFLFIMSPFMSSLCEHEGETIYAPLGSIHIHILSGGFSKNGINTHIQMLKTWSKLLLSYYKIVKNPYLGIIIPEDLHAEDPYGLASLAPYDKLEDPLAVYYDIMNFKFPYIGIVNCWPKKLVEKVGNDKIKTLPHYKWKQLDDGGMYFYYPFDRYYEYDVNKHPVEGAKHLGIS